MENILLDWLPNFFFVYWLTQSRVVWVVYCNFTFVTVNERHYHLEKRKHEFWKFWSHYRWWKTSHWIDFQTFFCLLITTQEYIGVESRDVWKFAEINLARVNRFAIVRAATGFPSCAMVEGVRKTLLIDQNHLRNTSRPCNLHAASGCVHTRTHWRRSNSRKCMK